MSNYKEQLLFKLIDSGWELVEIMKGVDWWAEAHWKIKSIRQNWGMEIFIHFNYDPMGFCGMDKHKVVIYIDASTEFKNDRISNESLIADIYLQKGKFKENLQLLVNAINAYRNGV